MPHIRSAALIASILLIEVLPTLSGAPHQQDSNLWSVNFISIGAGTDQKAEERFLTFVKEFQKRHRLKVDYTSKHWGKEGENEYVIRIDKLSDKQRKEFLEALQKMFGDNRLVILGPPKPR